MRLLPRRLLPDPASARHLLLRASEPLPLASFAEDPRAIHHLRSRPHSLADALARCLRDYAAAGPDVRVLPLLLLAARLAVPVPALLPALGRRRARAAAALAAARAPRQRAFFLEQVRALDSLSEAFRHGRSPGRAADAVVFGCRAAFPAAWAVRDVLAAQGLPPSLVPDPDADQEPTETSSAHARLHLAAAVAATAALPDLQARLRSARDARRARCIRSAAAVCALHGVAVPERMRPHLVEAMASLPIRDRRLLETALS
jgi:F0F1-type ATP synthase membrane subunit c/vacuolar-type H+-ATPase subunit K